VFGSFLGLAGQESAELIQASLEHCMLLWMWAYDEMQSSVEEGQFSDAWE
jgi:hypothetical protein